MATTHSTNRRTLLLSTIAGVISGGAWGATIQALATSSRPTLSIIGKGSAQIVLLDTTQLRVLFLLGAPENDLLAQVPALLTVLHQRIDILVGTSNAISPLGANFRRRWRVAHVFFLPDGEDPDPAKSGQTQITEDVVADLGGGISLRFFRSLRNAWSASDVSRELWIVTIATGAMLVTLAPDSYSAEILAADGAVLMVVPSGDVARLFSTRAPAAIATNARDDLGDTSLEGTSAMLVRIYAEDIARFEIREDGIALPVWAEGKA